MENQLVGTETVCRKKPINIQTGDEKLFAHEYKKDIAAKNVEFFENIEVFGSRGFMKKGFYVLLSSYFQGINVGILLLMRAYIEMFVLLFQHKNEITCENAIYIVDNYSLEFFHWFGDILQKLEALDSNELKSSYTIIIPKNNYFPWVAETLKAYSIEPLVFEFDDIIKCKNIMAVPHVAPTGNYRPELIKKMQKRILNYYGLNLNTSGTKRIYISREKAPKRKVQNESELINLLKKYSFEIINMEDLNFEDQVKLSNDSEIMLSIHGAGLTNMCWMNPNSKVFELRLKDDSINNCYFSLASALNLDYYYILCDQVNSKCGTYGAGFIVDLNKLEYELKKLFK
ncbi:hypothetical protein HNP88_001162 [Methanococcus maripaludis]|uniref:Glycosyltransferase 61 catalytic domain-containing protein n=1 Tax=Methanococcus maripaludis TaxID=39152 RepID=A0A7J9NQF0_METMI|nr:glycosyltransferase family 61 protein [Methanococcus maripaludis]MBA2846978.1 hypothetical protein [Methanococcus maripaludis]